MPSSHITGGLYHLCYRCVQEGDYIADVVVATFVGRCGLCATTLFSDGGRHRSRVPIGGIYNAVFIRRQQNLHRPAPTSITRRPHHAPKNKTADKTES